MAWSNASKAEIWLARLDRPATALAKLVMRLSKIRLTLLSNREQTSSRDSLDFCATGGVLATWIVAGFPDLREAPAK